jgi:hypothetical protein
MRERLIQRVALVGYALLAFSIAQRKVTAQVHGAQFRYRPTNALTLEGPAIHELVTEELSGRELRELVTDFRTVRGHPDLTKYYRNKAHRLELEAEKYAGFARAAGDTTPLNEPNHYNVGRTARFDYIIAKDELRQARDAKLLAALNAQAEQREGCFMCHGLHGRGGTIAPDLAIEGTRNRPDAWLIGHFKDLQAYSPKSVMPSFDELTNLQLETLARFLQDQK